MNQFFYTAEFQRNNDKGETEIDQRIASFNVNKVIRTFEYEPRKLCVILDDFHEDYVPKTKIEKSGKKTVTERKECIFSEIYLNEEDTQRFINKYKQD